MSYSKEDNFDQKSKDHRHYLISNGFYESFDNQLYFHTYKISDKQQIQDHWSDTLSLYAQDNTDEIFVAINFLEEIQKDQEDAINYGIEIDAKETIGIPFCYQENKETKIGYIVFNKN